MMKPKVKELHRLLQYWSVTHVDDDARAERIVAKCIPVGTGHPWVDEAKSLAPKHVAWESTEAGEHIVVVEYQIP